MESSQAPHRGWRTLPPPPPQPGSDRQSCGARYHAQGITTSYRQNLLKEERVELFARLRGCHTEPTAVAGNLDDPPQRMSVRHLNRKLTQSRDSAAINGLLGDNPPTMDTGTGSTPCQAGGRPRCWTQFSSFQVGTTAPHGRKRFRRALKMPALIQKRAVAGPKRGFANWVASVSLSLRTAASNYTL